MLRRLVITVLFVGMSLSSACLPCCGNTVAGDSAAPLTVEPLAFVGDRWVPVEEGSAFPTIIGGQGFTMMVVGARAQNVDTCGVGLRATLTRTDREKVIYDAEDDFNLSFIDDSSAGSTDGEGTQGVQLIPCGIAIEDGCPVPVRIEVTMTDRLGHSATASRTGTFSCGPLYGDCPADGGVDAGP
ncbi:MAG: hypothetical protein IRZ16_11100 [Myxococcaceae bacterium]|nr:hypothetical protein [Myxococcaceae bacterium]